MILKEFDENIIKCSIIKLIFTKSTLYKYSIIKVHVSKVRYGLGPDPRKKCQTKTINL